MGLLAKYELQSDYIFEDKEHETGTVSVSLDDTGIPQYTIHENVAWDFVPETPVLLELAGKVDAICFGSLAQRSPMSRKTIASFLDAARPDCLKVFDINLRQHYYDEEVIRDSLNRADVLKLNDDELPVLIKIFSLTGEESEVLAQLRGVFNLQYIVLTEGAKGAVMSGEDEEVFVAGIAPETIVDTVGAGDAFTAAITVGLLEGQELTKVCAHANQLASYVCSQHGAMPPLPKTLLI
jgi:fructokinase